MCLARFIEQHHDIGGEGHGVVKERDGRDVVGAQERVEWNAPNPKIFSPACTQARVDPARAPFERGYRRFDGIFFRLECSQVLFSPLGVVGKKIAPFAQGRQQQCQSHKNKREVTEAPSAGSKPCPDISEADAGEKN